MSGEDVSDRVHRELGDGASGESQSRELNSNFDNSAIRNDTALKDRESLTKETDKEHQM